MRYAFAMLMQIMKARYITTHSYFSTSIHDAKRIILESPFWTWIVQCVWVVLVSVTLKRPWPIIIMSGGYFGQYPTNTKHLYNIYTTSANVFDFGSTLYKCYANVLCLLGNSPAYSWSSERLMDIWFQFEKNINWKNERIHEQKKDWVSGWLSDWMTKRMNKHCEEKMNVKGNEMKWIGL